MADIVRRGQGSSIARREWDPFETMRELLRWDPFQEMTALAPAVPMERGYIPAFEVCETKDAYVFKADLPGVREQDLDISITGNRLTVSGKREEERREESERYFAYERNFGTFSRSFTLPEGIDADHVQANLKEGVLHLAVPKKAEAQPKKISVGSTKTVTGTASGEKAKA